MKTRMSGWYRGISSDAANCAIHQAWICLAMQHPYIVWKIEEVRYGITHWPEDRIYVAVVFIDGGEEEDF